MAVLPTKARKEDALYQSNYQTLAELVRKLSANLNLVHQGGGVKAQQRQREKGKLPVRERIAKLLDENTSLLEIGQFAAWNVYDEPIACAGVVAGIGQIQGIECMVIANDPSVKGGTYFPLTVKKHLRAQEIA
ncbi:methylcrotonoyl-CoA carboxylase, partial [Vibrio vulnificus]